MRLQMSFDWLTKFQGRMKKEPDYAEKALASYRLGMRAKGSIIGVVLQRGSNCCEQIKQLPDGEVYHPDTAPHLPLPQCSRACECDCVYRPVMTYQEIGDRET
jgi:hypothetical protein